MDNNGNGFGFENEPIRRYRRKRNTGGLITGIAVFCAAAVVVGAVIFVMSATGTGLFRVPSDSEKPPVSSSGDGNGGGTGDSEGTTVGETSDGGETTPPDTTATDPSGVVYKFVDMKPEDIREGDLLLLDADHPYSFPAMSLVTLYGNKTSDYLIQNATNQLRLSVINQINAMMADYVAEVGYKNITITGGYRSYEDQEELYNRSPMKAAQPGCSDYHLGASFCIEATEEEKIYSVEAIAEAKATWFKNNMGSYGFISRYPTNKSAITGYKIPWQIRYIGVPHASYINSNNLCLEEYLERIADNYKYSGEHLNITEGGKTYEVFYVEGASEGIIKVPVPENRDYTVSGDNKNGFIVTVVLG